MLLKLSAQQRCWAFGFLFYIFVFVKKSSSIVKGDDYYEKKIYEAYVIINLKDYFEDKLRENEATMLTRVLVINSNNNELLYYYTIEAEEGIIDPKWEVKAQR